MPEPRNDDSSTGASHKPKMASTTTAEQTLPAASMFAHSQNLSISGGNFNIYPLSTDQEKMDKALEVLQSHIATGASYDCAARSNVPKCHPETREAIIANIKKWVTDPKHVERFLWIYGPAGCGKTTIAETIAQICDEDGSLAGSFFFSRSANDRPKEKTHLVTTLVAQLCVLIPNLRDHVALAIDRDQQVFSKTLAKQMERLLIEPLNQVLREQQCRDPSTLRPRLIIIDGLDECDSTQSQVEIVELLPMISRQLAWPLRILIASRPEHAIRRAFARESSLSLSTRGIPLDTDYRADSDIKKFLVSRFAQIRKEHPAGANLPTTWPADEDLAYILMKSSGQFIYPSVAMNYIESVDHLPTRRLEEILEVSSAGSTNDMPFAQLDAVYTHVLSLLAREKLKLVLEILLWMIGDKSNVSKTLDFADKLFSCDPGTTRVVLTGVNALIFLPEPSSTDSLQKRRVEHVEGRSESLSEDETDDENSPNPTSESSLRFFHASFPDYLTDRSRSGNFFIDSGPIGHSTLARLWMQYYSRYCSDPSVPPSQQNIDRLTSVDVTRAIFSHCQSARLTSELQEDIYSMNLHAALTTVGPDPKEHWWPQVLLILKFIIWVAHQEFPDPTKDLYNHHLRNTQEAIQLHFLQYPLTVRKYLATALTFPLRAPIANSGYVTWALTPITSTLIMDIATSDHLFDPLALDDLAKFLHDSDDSDIFMSSPTKTLLCQILSNFNVPMMDNFFVDARLYTDLAFQVAEVLTDRLRFKEPKKKTRSSCDMDDLGTYWPQFLSKAAPDAKLAMFLRNSGLHVDIQSLPELNWYPEFLDKECYLAIIQDCLLASLIYIKESGIPFREHTHPPEFDPEHWYCAICATATSEDELSLDPAPEPIVEVIEAPRFLRVNFLARFAPVLEILRIQIWIAWLVEMMKRVFIVR